MRPIGRAGTGQGASRRPGGQSAQRQPVSREQPPGGLYGALDLGTNNCRLLIATPSDHGFLVVDAFSRIVRLGERLAQTGRLSDDAMDRTIEALRVCANKLRWRNVKRVRLVATEACRMAGQRSRIHRPGEDGDRPWPRNHRPRDRSGSRRRRRRAAGRPRRPRRHWSSTSAAARPKSCGCKRNGLRFETVAWTSLAAGVVTISERFGGGDGRDAEVVRGHARHFLRPMLQEFAGRVSAGQWRAAARAVASARHLRHGHDHCRRATWACPL